MLIRTMPTGADTRVRLAFNTGSRADSSN